MNELEPTSPLDLPAEPESSDVPRHFDDETPDGDALPPPAPALSREGPVPVARAKQARWPGPRRCLSESRSR
jgi:hypothetical protein